MTHSTRLSTLAAFVVAASMLAGAYARSHPSAESSFVLTDAEKQVITEFNARVADHAALHQTLDGTLPALPGDATPEQIDQHQRELHALIASARKDAQRGEFFTPAMEALVRRALGTLLGSQRGADLKATIMDDNPGAIDVRVNDRYPDEAPVSSMPAQLLELLPKLPDELEYRFLGKRIILVCAPGNIVLDLTRNVLP
jgi:hypothetical protein